MVGDRVRDSESSAWFTSSPNARVRDSDVEPRTRGLEDDKNHALDSCHNFVGLKASASSYTHQHLPLTLTPPMPALPHYAELPRLEVTHFYDATLGAQSHRSKLNLAHQARHRGFEAALLERTLPHHEHRPTRIDQRLVIAGIAGLVARELCLPEGHIALWHREVTMRAAMPEATIHEYCHLASRIAHVRSAGALLPVKSIARESRCAQSLTHKQLGLGVLAFVCLHHMACGDAHLGHGS